MAVQEVAHTDTILGIIPQGTFNNFATALKLPQDLPSALRVIKDGKVQKVSLGKLNGRYFTESAGVGIFADGLALYGNGSNKNLLRAIRALCRVLFSLPKHRLRITIDGETTVERATMCIIANSFRIGQGLPIAPEAKLTDDVLDIIIVGDLKRRELLPYFRALRAQLHPSLPKVTVMQGKEITLESFHHLNVHCDDKVVTTTPVTISIEPTALQVLVERL